MHDLTTKSIKISGTMLSYNKKIENDEKLMNKKSYHSRENYYVYSFSVIKDYTPCWTQNFAQKLSNLNYKM